MPQAGDSFTVQIGASQRDWGTFRKPTNRALIEGEGYIAIPKSYAVRYNIFNSNNQQTGLGYNEFIASTADGFIQNEVLLAQGSNTAGDPYAKNFAVKGDLKRIGSWYANCGVTDDSSVRVTFTSPTNVLLEIV